MLSISIFLKILIFDYAIFWITTLVSRGCASDDFPQGKLSSLHPWGIPLYPTPTRKIEAVLNIDFQKVKIQHSIS